MGIIIKLIPDMADVVQLNVMFFCFFSFNFGNFLIHFMK